MKYKAILYIILLGTFSSCFNKNKEVIKEEILATELTSIDGPYIYTENDSIYAISVEQKRDTSFVIKKMATNKAEGLKFKTEVNNSDKDNFTFSLAEDYNVPDAIYDSKEKIFVTSDIEGNFNALYSLLVGNNIMDKDYNWTYGNGHFVFCGDMLDRGTDILPSLWLLYKLEQEAKKNNGQVHYILGNHEVMNLQLDIRYVNKKYIELAKIISGIDNDEEEAYQHLMSDTNELVRWIQTKNTIEIIGNNLFTHAGISKEVVDTGLSLQEINDYVRQHIRENLYAKPGDDAYANLLLGRLGPLWYRGLVKGRKKYYEKVDAAGLENILSYYDVDHIIIGHTIAEEEVSSDFYGKIIRVDIKHPKEKFTGRSQALLIENGKYYKVNDIGEKVRLDFTK